MKLPGTMLKSQDAAVGTVSFTSTPSAAGIFVPEDVCNSVARREESERALRAFDRLPEDDDEYQLLPQAGCLCLTLQLLHHSFIFSLPRFSARSEPILWRHRGVCSQRKSELCALGLLPQPT